MLNSNNLVGVNPNEPIKSEEPELARIINSLDMAVAALAENYNILSKKLEPVKRNEPESQADLVGLNAMTTIGGTLSDIELRVRLINSAVNTDRDKLGL